MDINQLLSTPAATLLSPSKLPCLQSNTVSGLERPVIIPLGSSTNLTNPLSAVPMPLLNQQFLVPMAAFKESVPLLPTPLSSSLSHLDIAKSQPEIYSHLGSTFGMNPTVAKDSSSFPLVLDSNLSSIIKSQEQTKSNLNQNMSVQYVNHSFTKVKEKITDTANTQEVKEHKTPSKLPGSNAVNKTVVKSISNSTSTTSNDSSDDKDSEKTEMSNSEGKLDVESLSRIISSLPPGWKVVGLTNLTGTDRGQPTPVLETHNIQNGGNTSCDNTSHSPSQHHRCGIPDVVSVDLNVPTTLSLTDGMLNDTLASQKIGNITFWTNLTNTSCTNLTNTSSTNTSSTNTSSTKVQKQHLTSSKSVYDISTDSNHDISTDSNQFSVKIKKEVDTPVCQEPSQQKVDLDMTKSEWRVVGLTSSLSLPPTPVSNTSQQVATTPFPLLISSELGGLNEERLSNSRSPKATILNVPSPKLIQQSVKIPSLQKSVSADVLRNGSEDMKWTIVGVTMATTIGTATLSENDNGKDSDDSVIADCVVTNSQQRPLSSSVSKNAPLSSEIISQGIDPIFRDNWKVVGITQSISENQIPQIAPIKYQSPVPLLQQPQQPVLVTSVSSPTTISTSLNSNNVMMSHLPRLSSPGLLQNSLPGTLNNSMSLIAPSLLPLPSSQCNSLLEQQQLLHLVQNQIQLQQQEQRQMMVNHIQSQLAIQNQIPFMNALNEWNLVGLLSNIQSPLINTGNQTGNVITGLSDPSNMKTSSSDNSVESVKTSEPVDSQKQMPLNAGMIKKEDSDSSTELKPSKQSRHRDIASKYTKKNTVSHLLKLKRMKMKGGEDGPVSQSDQEGYEVVMSMKHNKGEIAFLTRADKGIRSRPLHSYAGNRKIFSRTVTLKREPRKEKISLRSGNLVPVQDLSLDTVSCPIEVKKEPSTDETGSSEMLNESSPVNHNRSAARKRKLKIPRKMIADVDYQPFDSSSDSN